jgi:hypothetical protein
MQTCEVQVAAVEQIEGAGLGDQLIEYVDLGKARFADVQKRGDGSAQIEQGVQSHASFGLLRWSPWEQCQA